MLCSKWRGRAKRGGGVPIFEVYALKLIGFAELTPL